MIEIDFKYFTGCMEPCYSNLVKNLVLAAAGGTARDPMKEILWNEA